MTRFLKVWLSLGVILAALVVLFKPAVNAQSIHQDIQKVLLVDATGTAISSSTDATDNTAFTTTGPQIKLDASSATPSAVGADGRSLSWWGDTVGRGHITGDASMSPIITKENASTPDLANALSTTVHTTTGSAATLTGYFCWNPNASAEYVQIFDISGTVTLGTSTPKWSIAIPPTSAGNLSMMNISFANAIKVAATTTATGSTAPGTALDCNFAYK